MLVNDNDDSRRMVESCYKRTKTMLNPIIDWSDADVWNFIRKNNIPYCSIYDEGFSRVGCIGCPMGNTKQREVQFAKYPKYKENYLRAFNRLLKVREERGLQNGKFGNTPQDVFNWWMEYDILPGQISFDDILEDEEGED